MGKHTSTRSFTITDGGDDYLRRILSHFKPLVMSLVLLLVAATPLAAQSRFPVVTATQSVLVESGSDYGAMGTVIVDMALNPKWHITYIHDRGWFVSGRYQEHDVSVTRVFEGDKTATLGWRVKIPEDGRSVQRAYVIWAWRWGG